MHQIYPEATCPYPHISLGDDWHDLTATYNISNFATTCPGVQGSGGLPGLLLMCATRRFIF